VPLRQPLASDRISQLDLSVPATVSPTATVRDAVARMREARKGCVLICDDRRLVGIFTERDFLIRVVGEGVDLDAPVTRYMTASPATIHPANTIGSVIRKMLSGGYRHLPVVDEQGVLGIVSVRALIHYLVEHFPTRIYNLPPEPRQVQRSREGA